MPPTRVHHPPPAALVLALVSAGISLGTAMAMERWKAQEVLDLLGGPPGGSPDADEGPSPRAC